MKYVTGQLEDRNDGFLTRINLELITFGHGQTETRNDGFLDRTALKTDEICLAGAQKLFLNKNFNANS